MTAPPNAPEVDVLAVLKQDAEDAKAIREIVEHGADVRAASSKSEKAIAAVAALLTREAALAEQNDLLSRANIAYSEQVAKLTGRALNSEEREAALVDEVAGLREDIADRNRAVECKNIDIRERDRSISGWAERAKKAEAERDALAAEVGALRLDAERYRFAREVNLLKWPKIRAGFELGDEHFDAAIDKARAEAGHG